MNRRVHTMLFWGLGIAICVAGAVFITVNQPRFGAYPTGARLARLQASPNYMNGEFKNIEPTEVLQEGQSSVPILIKSLFKKEKNLRPPHPLPTGKTDLHALAQRDTVVWMGHSSYFIQLGGKKILVDPVFSDYGAPFSFINTIFPGTGIYSVADIPNIDLLLITHDHWDHLDHPSSVELMNKVKNVVAPLGVGAHFEHWGYPANSIHEADWNESLAFDTLTIHVTPARHFSGRLLTRNKTLWAGFALETPEHKLFISGDGGYGQHFAEIGRRYGKFDLVMLEGGQYNPRWPQIHMTPEEAVKAAEAVGAKSVLLSHVGKFSISYHSWDSPFIRMAKASAGKDFRLLTPKIGDAVFLDDANQSFGPWWEELQGTLPPSR